MTSPISGHSVKLWNEIELLLTGIDVDIAEWNFGPGAVSLITDWYSRFTSDHDNLACEGFEDVDAEAVERLLDFLADCPKVPVGNF
jgi:hypothetical protein